MYSFTKKLITLSVLLMSARVVAQTTMVNPNVSRQAAFTKGVRLSRSFQSFLQKLYNERQPIGQTQCLKSDDFKLTYESLLNVRDGNRGGVTNYLLVFSNKECIGAIADSTYVVTAQTEWVSGQDELNYNILKGTVQSVVQESIDQSEIER